MTNELPSAVAKDACRACGRAVPRNAPGGICPPCLMQEGLKIVSSTRARPGEFAPPTIEEMALLFPDFHSFAFIGRGGMGAVYSAVQSELDRIVALKVLPPETGADAEFTERFRREAATLARLDHPNIVKLFDYGQREGFAYFVMEFVDGVDLSRRLHGGLLPLDDALAITNQLCEALEHSHARGVIHRDIKPANILITREGSVKVADFGVARLVHANDERLTRTRSTLGTPRYMAPEQMTPGEVVDHRADIFAVGVVLYEMLTGVPPGGSFDAPSEKVPSLNPRLDQVVLHALGNERERRSSSAAELKTELRRAIEQPAPTRRDRIRTLMLRALMVSLAAAVLGALAAFYWARRNPDGEVNQSTSTLDSGTSKERGISQVIVLAGIGNFPLANEHATSIAMAATRNEFGLLLKPDGTVLAWGDNRFGQTNVPAGLDHVVAIAAGQGARNAHALALRADGTVRGWGDNTFRQATPPAGLRDVTAIAAGEVHSLALSKDGHVTAWGNPASESVRVPKDLPSAKAIAAGANFSLALTMEGNVIAWGANDSGQCDAPKMLGPIIEIVAGTQHVLARLQNGRVVAWGNNRAGQCHVPTNLPSAVRIFAGGNASAALDANGHLHAWGDVPPTLRQSPQPIKELAIGSATWVALGVESLSEKKGGTGY